MTRSFFLSLLFFGGGNRITVRAATYSTTVHRGRVAASAVWVLDSDQSCNRRAEGAMPWHFLRTNWEIAWWVMMFPFFFFAGSSLPPGGLLPAQGLLPLRAQDQGRGAGVAEVFLGLGVSFQGGL